MVDNNISLLLREAFNVLNTIIGSINKIKSSNDMMLNCSKNLTIAVDDDGYDYIYSNLTKTKSLIEEAIQNEEILIKKFQEYIDKVMEATKEL